MIVGRFQGASPTIVAELSFPSIDAGVPTESRFMLDTGANFSIAHPADIAQYLDFSFAEDEVIQSRVERLAAAVRNVFGRYAQLGGRGIGGGATYFEIDASFGTLDLTGTWTSYGNPIAVAMPTIGNWEYPSILGMDFLSYFDMHFNHPQNIVELTFIEPTR